MSICDLFKIVHTCSEYNEYDFDLAVVLIKFEFTTFNKTITAPSCFLIIAEIYGDCTAREALGISVLVRALHGQQLKTQNAWFSNSAKC